MSKSKVEEMTAYDVDAAIGFAETPTNMKFLVDDEWFDIWEITWKPSTQLILINEVYQFSPDDILTVKWEWEDDTQ